jgi:hypothetical protein
MAHAYGNAPRSPLWTGLRFLPVLVMPAAFVLLICGVLAQSDHDRRGPSFSQARTRRAA